MDELYREATMEDLLHDRLTDKTEITEKANTDQEGENIVLPTGDVEGSRLFTKSEGDVETEMDYVGAFQDIESGETYIGYQNTKIVLDTVTAEGTQEVSEDAEGSDS